MRKWIWMFFLVSPLAAQVSKPVPTPVPSVPASCPIGNLYQITPGNSGAGNIYGNSGTGTTCALVSTPGGSSGITALTGDVTASGSGSVVASVKGINGTLLSGLATGLLKNTTGTGVPSIAVAGTDYVGLASANTLTGLNTFSNSPGTGSGAYGALFSGTPSTSSLFNPVVYINGGGTTPSWTNESPELSINVPGGYSSSANEFEVNANGTNEAYVRNNGNFFARGTVLTNAGVTINNSTNAALILQNSGTSEVNLSYSGTVGLANVGTGGTAGTGGSLAMSGLILVAAAPTVSASQIGYGSTTAAASNCGTTPTACIVVNVAGVTHYVPYY